MSTKFFLLLLPVLICLGLMGSSLNPPDSPNRTVSMAVFTAQTSPLPEALAKQPNLPGFVFQKSLEALRSETLRAVIWEKRHDRQAPYEAETKLLRGASNCMRMEMSIRSKQEGGSLKVVSVSDGKVLAIRSQFEQEKPVLQSYSVPTGPEAERFLTMQCCAGPFAMIQELQAVLTNLQVEAGKWSDKEVYRIIGQVDFNNPLMTAKKFVRFQGKTCHVMVDAKTFLPVRIEWCSDNKSVWEIEFREMQISEKMSYDDCVREFTMKP